MRHRPPGFYLAAFAAAAACGCRSPQPVPAAHHGPPAVAFRDVTVEAGIDFQHVNGATGRKYMPETMGSGCAFVDFDNDGKLDILLVNGDYWPGQHGSGHPTLKLYRNLDGHRFED